MQYIGNGLYSKRLVVFGTGTKCVNFLNTFSYHVDYFIDNDKKKHHTVFMGREIHSPDRLQKENKNEIFIIISSSFYDEIAQQLINMGYQEGIHFIDDTSVLKSNTILDAKDMLAMQFLQPLYSEYLPWSSSAMRPSGLVKVINEIIINQRKAIVECGGGISTFLIAKVIKENSGKLYTIEHDKNWSIFLQDLLKKHDLMENVKVIYAPLVETKYLFSEEKVSWYEESIIHNELKDKKIDFLIIDGPPAFYPKNEYSRYPAVPFFWDYLAEDHAILIDDIDRRGEREIISRWEKEFNINFGKFFIDGGVGMYRSKKTFAV